MKNARQVFMCKHVGELHFQGLQGSVVVGKPISIKIILLHFLFKQNYSFWPAENKISCMHHCHFFNSFDEPIMLITNFKILLFKEMTIYIFFFIIPRWQIPKHLLFNLI